MFIRYFVRPEGLRAYWRVETVPGSSSDFARTCRQSENVELDKVLVRGDEWRVNDLLGIVAIDRMRNSVRSVDRWSRNTIWNGDIANSTNRMYKECNGILKQIEGVARVVDASDRKALENIVNECKDDRSARWCVASWYRMRIPYMIDVFGCPAPQPSTEGLQDLYILPLGGESGVYEQRVDYRSGETRPDDVYFWTDDGEFLWQPYQNKWDFHITCQTEFKVIVPKPELVTIVKSVPIESESSKWI